MTDISLFDEQNRTYAGISPAGEVYISPRFYSTPYFVSVALATTAYPIVPALSGHKFIVTSILIASDKDFGSPTAAETVTLYEASPADIDTNLKTFAQVDLLKNDRLVATGLNIATSDAVSLIGIADSAAVDVTVAGFYIPC